MANVTINTLTELSSEPLGASFIPIWESGATKKVSITNLLSGYLPLSGGTLSGDVNTSGQIKGTGYYLNLSAWQHYQDHVAIATSGALGAANGAHLAIMSSGHFGWASSGGATSAIGLKLLKDADNILAQQRTTNAQEFRIYGTYTDASNYERLALRTAAGDYTIAAEAAGTGTKRNLVFDGANRGAFIDTPSSGTDGDYEAAFGSILAILESHGLMSGA